MPLQYTEERDRDVDLPVVFPQFQKGCIRSRKHKKEQ